MQGQFPAAVGKQFLLFRFTGIRSAGLLAEEQSTVASCNAMLYGCSRSMAQWRLRGATGHQAVRVGLRAPRVAVRVGARCDWQSMFALAMSTAAGKWGGYGFIYLPCGGSDLHPALARILHAYDPDYLVNARGPSVDVWGRRGDQPGLACSPRSGLAARRG